MFIVPYAIFAQLMQQKRMIDRIKTFFQVKQTYTAYTAFVYTI